MDDSNVFILSWDMYGLEACIDATDLDKTRTWNVLKDAENARDPVGQTLHHLLLRARYNPQRCYEIYSINTSPDISKEDIIQQFQDNPQGMAELIRDRGHKIFSDRSNQSNVKIT